MTSSGCFHLDIFDRPVTASSILQPAKLHTWLRLIIFLYIYIMAVPGFPTDLRLITALRYDPALLQSAYNTAVNYGRPSAYFLLPYHHERLVAAAHAHGYIWESAIERLTLDVVQDTCARAVSQHVEDHGPLKVITLLCRPPHTETSRI